MKKKYMHPRKKLTLKKLNNYQCFLCKKIFPSEELEIDHINPESNGGSNDSSNLIPLCIDCHKHKTSKEWKSGTYGNKIEECLNLSPKEKLDTLNVFLLENKHYTYPEISFLVQNHPILSKFEYNSNTLKSLFSLVKGYDKIPSINKRYVNQRDVLVILLKKKLDISYDNISKMLLDYSINLTGVQIGNICRKFDDKL